MKRIKYLFLIALALFVTGCDQITFNKDIMDDIDVYTSIYPIEYVTNKIYGKNANIVKNLLKNKLKILEKVI